MPEGIPAPGATLHSWEDLVSLIPTDVVIEPRYIPKQAPQLNQNLAGRLITPQEGCGTQGKRALTRIVGGSVARNDAWPWIVSVFI